MENSSLNNEYFQKLWLEEKWAFNWVHFAYVTGWLLSKDVKMFQ